MTTLRKILCVCVMAAVLVMAFPVSSLAVDPVSAATMANAFAQAVTAYGASHGVSMMFDVSNTSGIGEQVHELWQRFRSDQQTADDYATIAAAVWPGLYSKVQRVAGAVVGINLAAEYVADLDGFWNWLLSGPAEMTKVDNQYYEWTVNQSGVVDPIYVLSYSPFGADLPNCDGMTYQQMYENGRPFLRSSGYGDFSAFRQSTDPTKMSYLVANGSSGSVRFYAFGPKDTYSSVYYNFIFGGNYRAPSVISQGSELTYNGHVYRYGFMERTDITNVFVPIYPTIDDAISVLDSYLYDGVGGSSLSVQPYIGDETPQNVYIPDNEDVNYAPLPASIPLDISWDDSLYGDGQTLTDAQSEAIAGASDLVISDTGTLELADTASPPAPSPNEVYIPLLPVELPSFNFSLSGIWHYVVSWVQSLGAWLSLMFQTWAVLPSAITIPVYATAVIVIVLGVYKRFFM